LFKRETLFHVIIQTISLMHTMYLDVVLLIQTLIE